MEPRGLVKAGPEGCWAPTSRSKGIVATGTTAESYSTITWCIHWYFLPVLDIPVAKGYSPYATNLQTLTRVGCPRGTTWSHTRPHGDIFLSRALRSWKLCKRVELATHLHDSQAERFILLHHCLSRSRRVGNTFFSIAWVLVQGMSAPNLISISRRVG